MTPLSYLPRFPAVFSMYLFSSPLTTNQESNRCYPYSKSKGGDESQVYQKFCQAFLRKIENKFSDFLIKNDELRPYTKPPY